jgi:NAD(P)-dependent dehydrogenase (short-subunit alcohol dehydrogenase family)
MSSKLFDLSGQVSLVTGASRGIGEAIAKLLAQQGAHVIVASRKKADCDRVVDEIGAEGGSAESAACNVGRMEDIEAIFNMVREKHGRLDILVNNAATNPYYGHILDTDNAAYEKTVEVNLRGYFFMSIHAGRMMKAQGKGSIVNVASVNALQPGDKQGIYSVTKAAVVSMTRSFAKECGSLGIRVNALLPGLTKTKFAGALFEDEKLYKDWMEKIPLRRHADPDDMAGAVLYLVSEAAKYTTGECLVVDGGLTL